MTNIDTIRRCVADALALELDEVLPSSTLVTDLGAESIDLLDILFRVDRETGVKIESAELAAYIQGGISDEDFSEPETGAVTEKALSHLIKIMPQLSSISTKDSIVADDVMNHFTVENLTQLVSSRG